MSKFTSSIDIDDEILDNKFFEISRPSFLKRQFSDLSDISTAKINSPALTSGPPLKTLNTA